MISRDSHVPGAGGLQFRPILDLVGDVDELSGLLELRGVDEVHAHEVRHFAGSNGLGEFRDHLGMRDIGEVDLRSGFFSFHMATSVSTILALPPLRSHITKSLAIAVADDAMNAAADRPTASLLKVFASFIFSSRFTLCLF